jgi:hypothetical protein
MKPDRQRSRLYAWEDRVVAPHDPTRIARAAAQGMVAAIWAEPLWQGHGLRFPPKVAALPANARARVADASRLTIRLRPLTPSWCLLHEIAHAMTANHDGASDGHGACFVGVYLRLLTHYLRLPEPALLASLAEAGIAVDREAMPWVLQPAAGVAAWCARA